MSAESDFLRAWAALKLRGWMIAGGHEDNYPRLPMTPRVEFYDSRGRLRAIARAI